MQSDPKENRKHTRNSIELEAELHVSDDVYNGMTKNISFSGAYVTCVNAASIPAGGTGTLTLYLQKDPHPNIVEFQCMIVRTDESGMGIKFISTDLNGYQQFKNLMIYNCPDPDKLVAELEKDPGLNIK